MPSRDLLSSAQRSQLLTLPSSRREIVEAYTLTAADRDLIATHRTAPNRLGVAVQLCFLRHPGRAWTPEETVPLRILRFVADQIGVPPSALASYARRDQTRRSHFVELLFDGWMESQRSHFAALAMRLVDALSTKPDLTSWSRRASDEVTATFARSVCTRFQALDGPPSYGKDLSKAKIRRGTLLTRR